MNKNVLNQLMKSVLGRFFTPHSSAQPEAPLLGAVPGEPRPALIYALPLRCNPLQSSYKSHAMRVCLSVSPPCCECLEDRAPLLSLSTQGQHRAGT